MDKKNVFVIVPVYNEAAVLETALGPLIGSGYQVVTVDDASIDGSWKVLENLAVHRLRHPFNLGQGAALQSGMDYALQRGARYVVHFDADGQHRVEDIEELCAPLLDGSADIVLGSRFLRDEDRKRVPLLKRSLLRGAILVNRLVTGMWMSDAHNGLRALNRRAVERIRLSENRYAHASEILWLIRENGLKFTERPCQIRYSDYSKAKGQSAWNAINISIDLILRRLMI